METYKIGNKVTCIVRAYSAGKIGDEVITYDNQPYTILRGTSADLRFKDVSRTARDDINRVLSHNISIVDSITLSNIELTTKIMNLIFPKSKTKLAHVVENQDSDENKRILLNNATPVYQVFVYDNDGVLETESCLGEHDAALALSVKKANSNYLIVYSYEKECAYDLNNLNNIYLTLDLEIQGNTDDNFSKM